MNAKAQLTAVQAELQTIVDGSKSGKRDLTPDEIKRVEELADEAVELKATIIRQEKGEALMARLDGRNVDHPPESTTEGAAFGMPRAGAKGHVFLTGSRGKKSAETIARQLGGYGRKSLVATGTTITTVSMDPDPIVEGIIPTTVLEALHTQVRADPVYRYMRQTLRDNNAAIVAPGATKPTSVVSVESITGELQVFAHISEAVDEYLLKDAEPLASFLSTQLLYMLREAVEEEVLNGDGSTGHLRGILNASGIQTQAFVTDAVTTLRRAALQLESVGHSADLYIVNAGDWATIETQRVTSGSFDLGGPIDRATQKLWGTQVVTSTRIAAGTALALDRDAVGIDTDGVIETKWDQSTGFEKNQVRARVEGRFGLSVFQPFGIVKATITE